MSIDYILDASALLALLQQEPGAEIVSKHLSASAISAVNIAEARVYLIKLVCRKMKFMHFFRKWI